VIEVYLDAARVSVSNGGGANERQGQYRCAYAKIGKRESTKVRSSTQICSFPQRLVKANLVKQTGKTENLEKKWVLRGIVSKEKKLEEIKSKFWQKDSQHSDVRVQDKLLSKLKNPGSFVVTIYDRKHPYNFYCRIEVIDLPKEKMTMKILRRNHQKRLQVTMIRWTPVKPKTKLLG
jgi:hypothetical protein